MQNDPEIIAMSEVVSALEPLDSDARARVLNWYVERHELVVATGDSRGTEVTHDDASATDGIGRADLQLGESESFDMFADLYDRADPQNEEDRSLVAAYWWQVLQQEDSFTGYQINESLRDMGNGVKNITRSLSRVQDSAPALVRQLSKSGKSKQARKTYRLTNSGIKAVEAMFK